MNDSHNPRLIQRWTDGIPFTVRRTGDDLGEFVARQLVRKESASGRAPTLRPPKAPSRKTSPVPVLHAPLPRADTG